MARGEPKEAPLSEAEVWRRCSACKAPIALGATYWTCNVSTCNQKRTALAFCSVSCWEVHLPSARHRESWAVERKAPRTREAEAGPVQGSGGGGDPRSGDPAREAAGRRRLVRDATPPREAEAPREVLIIASRLKDYVRATRGLNTSDRVLEPLSDLVRRIVDEAVRNAIRDGRRTVLDRDVPRG